MKKSVFFIFSAFAFMFMSCERPENESAESPVLTPNTEEIQVLAEGGEYQIAYSLENPDEQGSLNASAPSDCDWIGSFNTDDPGIITFNCTSNESEATRESIVTVTYTWPGGVQSFPVNVIQAAAEEGPEDPDDPDNPDTIDSGFEISVTDITFSTAHIKIVPDNTDEKYIVYVDVASAIEGMTDEDLFAEDLAIMESTAPMLSMDLISYVNYICKQGEESTTQTKLNPGTEYAVWCYYINISENGITRISDIARDYFETKAQDVTENGITLDVEATGNTFSAIGTPYTDDRYYNLNWNSERILEQEGFTSGTPAERCYQFELDYMTSYAALFAPTQWANVHKGPASTSAMFSSPDTYYVFAYFMNDDGTLDGEITIKTIIYDGSTSTVVDAPSMSFLRKCYTDTVPKL